MQNNYSLRRRLLVRMGAAFLCILTISSFGLWRYAQNAANQTFDLVLAAAGLSILERITWTPNGPMVDIPYSAFEMAGLAEKDRLFYRIFDQKSVTLTGEKSLPLPKEYKPSSVPLFFNAVYSGEKMRFVLQGRLLTSGNTPVWIIVQLGQTRLARDQLELDLFFKGVLGLFGLAAIGLLFVWLGINRALHPLAGIERDIRQREPDDLTPLQALPPREVKSLIGSINDFMQRLKTSKEHAQTFIADVTHQIRTSLAALQGQLDLAADQTDFEKMRNRLLRAEEQSKRTIRLTNQLLSHAMVIHRAEAYIGQSISLTLIVRLVMEEIIRDTITHDIEFEFIRNGMEDQEAVIDGDPISIREALHNILNNAIKHGPKQNKIDVHLEEIEIRGQKGIRLSVEDSGPGIPIDQRQNALERFCSLNPENKGSGLGLNIVKSVVENHQGHLELQTSQYGGLRVQLDFPVKQNK